MIGTETDNDRLGSHVPPPSIVLALFLLIFFSSKIVIILKVFSLFLDPIEGLLHSHCIVGPGISLESNLDLLKKLSIRKLHLHRFCFDAYCLPQNYLI